MRCGNCGGNYSRYSPVNAQYCRHDKLFFCRPCAPGRRCRLCQGRTSKWPATVAIWAPILAIMCAIGFAWNFPAYLHETKVNDLGVSPLEGLPPGNLVKVRGVMEAPQGVVISGFENRTTSSWTWVDLYNFNLTDGKVTLFVNISNLAFVNDGPHPFDDNTSANTRGNAYWTGDTVIVVGWRDTTNASLFWAEDLSISPTSVICCATQIAELWGGGLAVGGALGATGLGLQAVRLRAHESTLRRLGGPRRVGTPEDVPPGLEVDWHPNPLYGPTATKFSRARWVVLVPAGILVLAGVEYLGAPGLAGATTALLILGFIVGLGTLVVVIPLLARRTRTPTRVGFSTLGLLAEYWGKPSPWTRPFGSWHGMIVATSHLGDTSGAVALEWPGEKSWGIGNLDPALARQTLEEIRKRTAGDDESLKPPATTLRLPGATVLPLATAAVSTSPVEWRPSAAGASSTQMRNGLLVVTIGLGALLAVTVHWAPSQAGISGGLFVGALLVLLLQRTKGPAGKCSLGFSDYGLFLRDAKGKETCYPWDEMRLAVIYGLGVFLYRNATGEVKAVPGLPLEDSRIVFDHIRQMRNPTPPRSPGPTNPVWTPNPLARQAERGFWGLFGGVTIAAMAIGSLSYAFFGGWLEGGIFGGITLVMYVFLLVPYAKRIQTPTFYALTPEGLFLRFWKDPAPIGAPLNLAWRDVTHARGGFDQFLSTEPSYRVSLPRTLSLLEKTGIVYYLQNVPPEVVERAQRSLSPGVLVTFKPKDQGLPPPP